MSVFISDIDTAKFYNRFSPENNNKLNDYSTNE